MTIATPSGIRESGRKAFTLVEVLLATALTAVIMGGVMSTALLIGRSGINSAHYVEMEQEARRGLEVFARDTRMAKRITWHSPTSMTLSVVSDGKGSTKDCLYQYDAATNTLSRTEGANTDVLFTHIVSTAGGFEMKGYKITGEEIPPSELADAARRPLASANTKELQLNLTCNRTRSTVTTSTNKVVSARFILRNKLVASK